MKQTSSLRIIRLLCQELHKQKINYCHWKSNAMLERSANGQNDLDLLIEQADSQRFNEIIHQLGFKEAVANHQERLPGIAHYYALDKSSGRLVHLHRYYKLIVGHDLTKNYHLPLETPFIQSATQESLFRVPKPEFELIIFVIRMVLKRPLFDLQNYRVLDPYASKELAYLQSRASMETLCSILQFHLQQVSPKLWQESLMSLQPSCLWWDRTRTGWKLHKSLRTFRRRFWILAAAMKLWNRYSFSAYARLTGRLPRKAMAQGGSIVAIVGGDGAGKSTAVREIANWLAKDFEVLQAHMGKPRKTWSTIVVELVIKLVSRTSMLDQRGWHNKLFPTSLYSSLLECLLLLRPVCIVHDRLSLYRKMRNFASRGGLVISDRYCLPWIKQMDSPKLGYLLDLGVTEQKVSRIGRILARLEKRYYQRISAPDILFVLQVNPEIAIQRKSGDNPDLVRKRSQEVWELDWGQKSAKIIDASLSPTDVLSMIKTAIWQSL